MNSGAVNLISHFSRACFLTVANECQTFISLT